MVPLVDGERAELHGGCERRGLVCQIVGLMVVGVVGVGVGGCGRYWWAWCL